MNNLACSLFTLTVYMGTLESVVVIPPSENDEDRISQLLKMSIFFSFFHQHLNLLLVSMFGESESD